jgi:hypothetical protein
LRIVKHTVLNVCNLVMQILSTLLEGRRVAPETPRRPPEMPTDGIFQHIFNTTHRNSSRPYKRRAISYAPPKWKEVFFL